MPCNTYTGHKPCHQTCTKIAWLQLPDHLGLFMKKCNLHSKGISSVECNCERAACIRLSGKPDSCFKFRPPLGQVCGVCILQTMQCTPAGTLQIGTVQNSSACSDVHSNRRVEVGLKCGVIGRAVSILSCWIQNDTKSNSDRDQCRWLVKRAACLELSKILYVRPCEHLVAP